MIHFAQFRIAVTGGVACGKSLVVRAIEERMPAGGVAGFNCDQAVSELWLVPEVVARVQGFLPQVPIWSETDGLNRGILRELLFENSDFRAKVEGFLHPLVLERAESHAATHADRAILLFEVPLLYEVGFPLQRDFDLVVATSKTCQIRRLEVERGISHKLANQIIQSQIPIEEKISRADQMIWNDGTLEACLAQVDHLVSDWKARMAKQ
jgi:dephospho-CoA kinase